MSDEPRSEGPFQRLIDRIGDWAWYVTVRAWATVFALLLLVYIKDLLDKAIDNWYKIVPALARLVASVSIAVCLIVIVLNLAMYRIRVNSGTDAPMASVEPPPTSVRVAMLIDTSFDFRTDAGRKGP